MWLSVLIFLATIAFTVAATGLAILLAVQHKTKLATALAICALSVVGLYAAVLVATGLGSRETTLAVGQEKHICEIDCHLAYAVVNAQPSGGNYAVTLRMRFDETTIGRERGNSPVHAGPRRILLIDDHNATHEPMRVLGLDTALHPGEATQATLVFQLPANARPARLRFEDGNAINRLLIGTETSLFHRHTDFALS